MADNDINDILHSNLYNDRYDPMDRYSMLLWRPDSAVMQTDLNSEQSFFHHQFKLAGDYNFHNGTIISGMSIHVSNPNNKPQQKTPNIADNLKNLLSQNDISAINATINRDGYTKSGSIDVAPNSESADSYPGVELYLNNINAKEFTVSFGVVKETGTLSNITIDHSADNQIESIYVDDKDATKMPLSTILNDGEVHYIRATFRTSSTIDPIYIVANEGLDMTQASSAVRFEISSLMVNKGDVAAAWRLSSDDTNLSNQTRNQVVTIMPGTVYLDGYIREFGDSNNPLGDQNTIRITGSGTERIGVRLERSLITAQPNANEPGSNLYDTTKGAISQGERLADRIQYNVVLTYNDSNAPTIYTLVNGKVYYGNSSTGNAHLDQILAKRTYDQSGSFRVSGFDFHTSPDLLDTNKGELDIDKGIAYVMGYGVYLEQPTTLTYDIPKRAEEAIDESVERDIGLQNNAWTSMPLGHQPMKKGSLTLVGAVQVGGPSLDHYIAEDGGNLGITGDHHFIFNNHILAPTEAGDGPDNSSALPDVFQPKNYGGNVAGGPVGDFTIFEVGQDDNTGDEKVIAAVTYDADSQNTYVKVSQNQSYDTDDNSEANQSIKMFDPNDPNNSANCYPLGTGIEPLKMDGYWYVQFDFDDSTEEAIFGEQLGGDSLYIQGSAHYEFTGPDEDNTNPDYRIISSNSGAYASKNYDALNDARVEFDNGKNESGVVPEVADHDLEATYEYYLAQVATLTLDKNGDFHLIKGTPAPLGEARPPEQQDPNTLRLGYVVLLPDTYESNCQFSSVTRIPFTGLQDLAARVRNLEMSMQNGLLNDQAQGHNDPTTINNTLNDDFTTFAAGDFSLNPVQAAYDLAHGKLSVNDYMNSIMPLYPSLDTTNSDYLTSKHLLMSALHDEYRQEWQDATTTSTPLNTADLANGSTNGLLSITPNADSFVDCSGYKFKLSGIPTRVQLHNWFTYDNSMYPKQDPTNHLLNSHSFGYDYGTRNLSQWSMRQETGKRTSQAGIEYATPRTIHFHTDWLAPNSTGYYIKIDDQYNPDWNLNLQPEDKSIKDFTGKTLKADAEGSLSGSFTLPSDVTTGTKKITLTNIKPDGSNIGSANTSEVSTTYEANGIDNDDTGTVERSYNATDNYGNITLPSVGETVLIRKDSVLTRVDLTFQNKPTQDTSDTNVLVQLRSVNPDNTPSDTVLAQVTKPASQIRVDGLATEFPFDDPIFVNKDDRVAITVYSPSDSYSLSVSTIPLGVAQDITYSNQDMWFTRSNGASWNTPTNDEAIKFSLYRASFNTDTQIKFQPIGTLGLYNKQKAFNTISKLALLVDYITPDNSSLSWEVRIGYGGSTTGVNYRMVPLNSRRSLINITDALTDSNEESVSDKNLGDFNQIVSLQLICNMNWDLDNQDAYDETANAGTNSRQYSRVSPMINLGTVALAISESKYHALKHHLETRTYTNSTGVNIYNSQIDGFYATRNLETFAPNYNTVITTFDAKEDPGFSRIIPIYSIDGGDNWHLFTNPNKDNPFKNYPKVVPVDHHFYRYTYKTKIDLDNNETSSAYQTNKSNFKMGLILLSNSPYHQPVVRRLTNALTLENGYDTNNAQPFMGDGDSNTWLYWNNMPTNNNNV